MLPKRGIFKLAETAVVDVTKTSAHSSGTCMGFSFAEKSPQITKHSKLIQIFCIDWKISVLMLEIWFDLYDSCA